MSGVRLGLEGAGISHNGAEVGDRTVQVEMVAPKAGNLALGKEKDIPTGDGLSDREQPWQDFANCLGVDPDLFFPERGASTREAKEVCRGCRVRTNCLEYAIVNGEKFGIWGGKSERERRRLRRIHAQSSRKAATE